MSFLDDLPVLLREPIDAQPSACKCGYPLEPNWDYCPSCGDWIDGYEDMYLCSLHRNSELSQETKKGQPGFHCVCLVCGATWTKPVHSIGKNPDFFREDIFNRYRGDYFLRTFGVVL